ncbi:MAG: hypothetical protein ABW190_11670 [Rhizobacter sp.]
MTLVIVGHEKVKESWSWNDKAELRLRNEGLFAVSDSVITSNGSRGQTPLLSGLRKVHPITIQLWKPYFVNSCFRDYLEVHQRSECFVAFSGSTLTATHAMNLISEHLGKLQISYRRASDRGAGTYVVQRHCEYNELRDTKEVIDWDEDMFSPRDLTGLLTASYISEVAEHSINVALRSAKQYRLTPEDVELMRTDFAVGIACPTTDAHRLFVYRMKSRLSAEGMLEIYAAPEEITDDKIAVLGMRKQFEARAQCAYDRAVKEGYSTGEEMFKFLNLAIDEVAASGSFEIDRPSSHKRLTQGSLEKVNFSAK